MFYSVMERYWSRLFSFLVCVLSLQPAFADEILLSNGDRLTGTVTTLKNSILTVRTSYSPEPIPIEAGSVISITTAQPVTVIFRNGEVLNGRLVGDDYGLRLEAPIDQTFFDIDWQAIDVINPPEMKPVTWKGNIAMGGSLQSGNVETTSIAVAAEAVRKTKKDRVSTRVRYDYGEDNGTRNAENAFGALKYDYFITSKTYAFLNLELANDQFKDINLRTVIGPGLGYQFWDDEKKVLGLEGGLAFINENHTEAADDSWISGRLAADFQYNFSQKLIIKDKLEIYPSIEQGGEYQLRNEAGILTELTSDWSLNFTNIYERNSDPEPGIKKNDIAWQTGLQYKF